ncbi:adenylyltransferase and sulfurtransferase MOCS3-2 [Dendrobium catenatum]|uniref:Adenylyltransferase and sulfurtransferase MOCS3 n=1 Tax=Dendrobium catenatum TaxID=906689 RepID=A0A2I0XC13_9ASPA|nr:adenylyltransferase and sulfurtransferase MOCS3-2 [Dendrobium catenatum]XP_020686058.1 adenylyltransferase and sulfurtransferase MOCS3-2 [Dendrobium catenatum]PKU85433.1 Adenylyltransferase and sulfurtransferase MOCS3 2 [Dendrobium catenatum]
MDYKIVGNGSADIIHEIEKLKLDKKEIENRISKLEAQLKADEAVQMKANQACSSYDSILDGHAVSSNGLTPGMIYRYSRHLLLPDFGVEGQINLAKSSILVVGAGGLGSPVVLYLASCGIGCIGIVDSDIVELNNLHRQIIHPEAYVGHAKVKSAAAACRAINSSINLVEHNQALQASNALDIVSKYDIVVDATDNLPSRYMISDCCVVMNKPLISGAALGLEGQLTVYHHKGGPCYRCLFPTPPPTAACQRCSDSGVLGVVPGVIGCLQALEAIKVASGIGETLSGRMLIFDALSSRIRIVKLRGRSLQCFACGDNADFTQQSFQSFDYEGFTQSPMSDKARPKLSLISDSARITSREYKDLIDKQEPHILVDVRPAHHFKITAIPESINIPLSALEDQISLVDSHLKEVAKDSGKAASLYVVCRRGNDSQRAVDFLNKNGFPLAKDIIGGLESWAQDVDPSFPIY